MVGVHLSADPGSARLQGPDLFRVHRRNPSGLRLDRPDCRYHPEDFTHLLEGLEVYRGSLAAYCGENRRLDGDPEYLRRHSLLQIAGCSLRTLACAADRSLFERPSGLPDVTGQYFAHTHR